jgi:hypothetical protein
LIKILGFQLGKEEGIQIIDKKKVSPGCPGETFKKNP